MKPHPSSDLLGPGQAWTIIQAPGWLTVDAGDCNFRDAGMRGDFCRKKAIVIKIYESAIARYELLCDKHIGAHRWIDEEGIVMQWRAYPPWKYQKPLPAPRPRKRKKETDA